MLQIRDSGGVMRGIVSLKMRDGTDTLRDIATLLVRDKAGTLRQVFSSTGAGLVTPALVNGTGRSNSSITVATILATAAAGGASYLWTQTSGDAFWSISDPTGAQTYFVHTNTDPDMFFDATFQVVITYGGGATATGSVAARVRNISGL